MGRGDRQLVRWGLSEVHISRSQIYPGALLMSNDRHRVYRLVPGRPALVPKLRAHRARPMSDTWGRGNGTLAQCSFAALKVKNSVFQISQEVKVVRKINYRGYTMHVTKARHSFHDVSETNANLKELAIRLWNECCLPVPFTFSSHYLNLFYPLLSAPYRKGMW